MINKIKDFFIKNGIETDEAKAEANFLVCEVSRLPIEKIITGEKIQNENEIWALAEKRIETGAPIQHITGFSYFMGDKFIVNSDVLIPRPETEILVQQALKLAREKALQNGELRILDIGTGTGCIAIEIAKNLPDIPCVDKTVVEKSLSLEVLGVDISTRALHIAIKNMEALNQQRRVVFRKSDLFSSIYEDEKFDIIVSNPPYIPIQFKDTLQNEVKNFDPPQALFANDKDGIEFYNRILEGAKKHLKPNGYVIFELGCTEGMMQSKKVTEIARKFDYTLEFIEKDLEGTDRVIAFTACSGTKI